MLLPLVAFADTMLTPAVMVDLYLAEDTATPVVASVDYSATTDATPTGNTTAEGYAWFSMPYTASIEGYVEAMDVAKSLDLNAGAIFYDTISKDHMLFIIEDTTQAKLLDMEKGMGHIRYEGELTVYFPRAIAQSSNSETLSEDEFADVMEPSVEVAPVEDTVVMDTPAPQEDYRSPAVRSAPTSPMRAVEGRIEVDKTLFGKKYYLKDARSGKRIARINAKSPVGMGAIERYDDRVVTLVGNLGESKKKLQITVRSVRLR